MADGLRLMALNQYEQAADRFSQALDLAKKRRIVNAYTAPNLAWLATALRCQAEKQPGNAPWKRGGLLCRAEIAARRALRTARWLQNDLPHALREYAQILAMRGNAKGACRAFRKSLEVAKRQGARHEYAQSSLAFGLLRRELGRRGAERQIAEAESALREMVLSEKDVHYGDPDAPRRRSRWPIDSTRF